MRQIAPKDPIIVEFLAEALPRLRSAFQPTRVILFGSRVRGDAREGSDLDLIVVSEKFRGVHPAWRMGQVLNAIDFPHPVDCACYTPAEFVEIPQTSAIVREALNDGLDAA